MPPVPERFLPLREALERQIETWIWVFARPGADLDSALGDYRRYSPWFSDLPRGLLADALLWGDAERCSERLAALRESLGIDAAILDLAGLDEPAAQRALDALAPAEAGEIP